ncbi:MAG TPA: aminotransferase class I/II-fold pyridoxal phosphate-dependent enzyme [Saprospiraceae bacterium]|nr:aminotransferase class I/II-fold pyridoxal phosphate-dependent enzyme [Saprospiraceae bacterium]
MNHSLNKPNPSWDEIINHMGEDRASYDFSISPPISQTSNFMFTSIEDLKHKLIHEQHEHVYTRGNNPTVEILRKKVAALEKTEDALITSSGAAAVAVAIFPFLAQGDHMICVQKPYTWTFQLIEGLLRKWGIECDYVDGTNPENIYNAKKTNTKLLFLESPNSLTFELQDLESIGQWAKNENIITLIDNSYASPLFQNPIEYGIDLVVHSGTKYLNGHSDVVCGMVCGSAQNISKIFRSPFMMLGCCLSPHDAWLIIRGLRTLPLRIQQSHDTTVRIVNTLSRHPGVRKIIYPHHVSHPQYTLALKQMKGCGGLFTLELEVQTKDEVRDFVHALQRFLIAVSWGGHESLVFPVLGLYDRPGLPDPELPWNMIRFYVGLESYEYLMEDLNKALSAIGFHNEIR